MQLKATKLAAILSRLRLAPLALFAALGLAFAAPQTAQAGNYYKFTFLRVKANPTGSGIAGKQLAISELALYDASMNRINLNLTKYTSSTPVGIGVNQFNISHAEMQKNDGALFNDCSSHGEEKWFVTQDIASVKPYVVMRLADNAEPAAFYNLASADSAVSYDNRLPAEWKLEYSTDCSSWQELDHRNLDDGQLPTSDRTWYAGAGAQVANTAPKTCFLIQSQCTQVEYINAKTRGPALRIFGFHLQADDYIETKVMFNDVPTSGGGANNHAIFCNRQGTDSSSSFCSFVINGKLRFDYGPAGSDAQCSTDTLSKDVEYVIKGDGVSDQKLTATTGSTTAATANRSGTSTLTPSPLTTDLLLFAHSKYDGSSADPQIGTGDSLARMKMYYFKVYEAKGSSSLRLDLIPVTVGSQVGMYDQVSGIFYKSVTGTEFTAGTSFLGRLVLDPRNVAADADPNASGGDIILKDGNDYIHIFTTPGTSTFTVKQNVSATATATALLVGGGGGGGNNCGGGGGGGGVTAVLTPTQLTSGDYSVTVGAGGAAALNHMVQGTAGGASAIGTLVSAPGGNGGYGFDCGNDSFKGGTAGTGGGKGGDSHGSSQIGSNGSNGSSLYNILEFSQAQVFGGGGGGGAYGSGHGNSAGGAGGGGKGSGSKDNLYATAGENGLGGGGGGGAGGWKDNTSYLPGGAGGSGIVIIRVSSGSGPDPQKKSISAASVTYSATSVAYDGLAHQPTLTVKLENVDITSQCEITWDKSGFIIAGTYTPTITAKSSSETYTGTVSNPGSFTINRKQITKPSAVQNLVYNGSSQTGVASGTGYTVTDGAKTNAGDYTASVSLSDKTNTEWADTQATDDQDIPWSIAKKMAATPVAVVTTYTGSTQDAPIKGASGNMLTEWKLKSDGQHAGSATADETYSVTVELRDTINYTYTAGATTAGYYWTITHVICTCSTYSSWTAGENNILRDKLAKVTGYGVGNENTAGVAVLTDGANPISSTNPTNAERCELKGNGETALTWDLGGQATVSELRVFVGVGDTSWGHANINITKLEYYDMTAGAWKELKFFAQTMPYYANNTKQVSAVISRDTGSALFENATQLRLTMYAPITISGSAYYSSLTEIEAIGEVHATPIPEENLPRLNPARTFKFDNTAKTVSLSDATYVDIVAGDGTGTETETAAGVYYVWVQPKPGYVWPDDESSAPRKYEWGIVPSDYADNRNFLDTLANHPNRVNATALPEGIEGGDIILRFPNPGGASHEFIHIYTNTAASGFVFKNNSGVARPGRALLVGGGGGGGSSYQHWSQWDYWGTGGGGGGGAACSLLDMSFNGTWAITVGRGGSGGKSGYASSVATSDSNYVAEGGGFGGAAKRDSDTGIDGAAGGSGGGAAVGNASSTPKAGQVGLGSAYGYKGASPVGKTTDKTSGGAGGGAGADANGSTGGYGFRSDIIPDGECRLFGGGGSRGPNGTQSATVTPFPSIGGGGYGTQKYSDFSYTESVNGLGGGGCGGGTSPSKCEEGGRRGSDGIVIIRYTDTTRTHQIGVVNVPEVKNFTFDFTMHDQMIRDTDEYTVSDDVTGMYIGDYTITLTLRDPDNMQWNDGTGSSQPKHIKWSIVDGTFTQNRSFFTILAANHNRVATDPYGVGADIIIRTKTTHDDGLEYYHYALVYANSTTINAASTFDASLLVVGGGGAGGQRGGGGGAGGFLEQKTMSIAAGSHTITVGKGGKSNYTSGNVSSFDAHTAGGGGAGAWQNNVYKGTTVGKSGACGGGSALSGSAAGEGNQDGNGGGDGAIANILDATNRGWNGGGGGAGAPAQEYRGGIGKQSSILGFEQYFAGGGGGGMVNGDNRSGETCGKGGGGNGSWDAANNMTHFEHLGESGMDGLGGGGGGGGGNSNFSELSGGHGGDGIVVLAYEVVAGKEVDMPQQTKMFVTYDGTAIDVASLLTSTENIEIAPNYETAVNAGRYSFTAMPAAGYVWTGKADTPDARNPLTFEFDIVAKSIQEEVVFSKIDPQPYSGRSITPEFTVSLKGGTPLLPERDYTISYVGNIDIGTATIKISGCGNYIGDAWTTFQIVADPNVTGYYVTADADGSGDGTGWTSPFTFQQALTAVNGAAVGTTNAIYMKVGTYKNTTGPWTATPNKRCFIHVLGGYLGVNLARSTTEYTVLDGEGERGLVSVTVNISQSSIDHGKWILFDQIKFYRGKRAYYINVVDVKGNYFSRFVNCRFIDNIAPAGDTNIRGSAIEVKGMSLPWVENCEFRGNKACTQYATTIFAAEPVSNWYYGLTLMNSLFVGNSSKVRPCVAHFGASENNNITIKSCTFAYNAVATEANREGSYATGANGGLVLDQRDYNGSTYIWDMTDTIFYGNRCNGKTGTDYRVEKGSNVKGQPKPQYLLFEKATAYVEEETTSAYADVDPNARHYIFGDPLFVTPLPAAVEFDANYNPTWYADSAKTVTVSPADMDVHLQSTKGRWNGSEWVIDANYSPAIDAGCPDSGFAEEPECNGGRINLGAYGNTAEASKSYDVTEEAATLSGAAGLSEVKQLDNGHTVLIFSNVTDAASFTVAEGGVARILVVGGGGNGGYGGAGYGGGGGGAGGVIEKSTMMLAAGTYTVVVGGSHQDSVLKDSSGTALITAVHGGNGGLGLNNDSSKGEDGGSGGGAGGHLGDWIDGGFAIVTGQGCDGSGGNYYVGHGGGGFSSAGTWGVESPATGGDGGNGYVSDITGEPCGYACGGGGGDGNNSGNVGKGGYVTIGGVKRTLGGNGGTGSTVGQPGVAGTGSGGGGTSKSGSNSGGAGGSGIVVVHLYSAWTPQFNVTLDPNGGTGGKTSVTATYGEDMPALDEGDLPTRTGYKFAGYSREGWEVTKMTGEESDILTEGTTKYAYSACDAITLNGVAFTATLQAGTTSGSVTFNPGMAQADGSSGNAGKGDATAYGKLMKNKVRIGGGDSLTVTLGGLAANHTYLVQLVCHEGIMRRGLKVDGIAYNCSQNGDDACTYGRSFVRRFKATAAGEYAFTLGKDGDHLQINALQVREIGGEDDSLLYYNDDGTSAKPWDILGDATLYAQWTKSVVSVARPTQGTASWTYDGQDHRPAYADTEGYTVAYSADAPWKNAGTYKVTFTLKDNCEWADGTDVTSPIEFTYTITQREVTLGWGSTSLTYNRTAQAPTCTAVSLVSGDSCTVTVTGQKTNVGTGYTATATGLSNSNYKLPSAKTTTFSIAKKALTVEGLKATDRPYDGTTTVAITGGTLKGVISGDTVTCEMPRSGTIADANVGTGKPVTYPALTLGESSAGNYSVERPSLTVNITQATITKVTLTSADATYDGLPHQPQVASVTANGKTFNSASTGWDVSYSRNDYTSVGTITVTATGKANLTGSASTSFTITAKALTDTMVMLSASSFVYNGTNQKPTVTVTDGSKTLVENTDYTLTNAGGTDVGNNYEVQVVGKGNYSGTITKTFAITQAENTWTTVPAISKTTYKANDPATLTPGVPRFGTVAGTIAKDGGAAGTFSGSLPTEVGSYVLTYSVAETQNYTGLSETLNFTVTEAAYDLHAISGTGPEIKDVPSSWLAAAFPDADKTQEAYQTEFLKVNASGVKAWQAYVLGFEGGQVATAKIVEETAQNADPATVTIQLKDLPTLREGTGCTVKYSLYAATSTEDLMNDRGTVVTNLAEEAYYKWPESTFEAPLDDLTENEPVRYYRIKVHFTFGGGGGGGDEVIKVFSMPAGLVVSRQDLADGWTKGLTSSDDQYLRSPEIDLSSAGRLADDGYVSVEYTVAHSKYNTCYCYIDFLDSAGNTITTVDAMKSVCDGFQAGDNIDYPAVFRIPIGADVSKIKVRWVDSNAARVKELTHADDDMSFSDLNVEVLGWQEAVRRSDEVCNEQGGIDWTAFAAAKTAYLNKTLAGWTRNLPNMQKALRGEAPYDTRPYNVLMTGDSLAPAPLAGCLEALIKKQWPNSNIRMYIAWNGNTGCYQYMDTSHESNTILKSLDFTKYDCVMYTGTTQVRHTPGSGFEEKRTATFGAIESMTTYIKTGAGDKKNPNCEIIMVSPLVSVDARLPWNGLEVAADYYDSAKYHYDHVGQACAAITNWDVTKDGWADKDYNPVREQMADECQTLGIAHWDLYRFAYDYLFRSGKPYDFYQRDAQHQNNFGNHLAARVMLEAFKIVGGVTD